MYKRQQREREWLEFAAILHDIGYLINSRQHHKHAYYLIKNSDLFEKVFKRPVQFVTTSQEDEVT